MNVSQKVVFKTFQLFYITEQDTNQSTFENELIFLSGLEG